MSLNILWNMTGNGLKIYLNELYIFFIHQNFDGYCNSYTIYKQNREPLQVFKIYSLLLEVIAVNYFSIAL